MDTGLSGFLKKLALVSLPVQQIYKISSDTYVLTIEKFSGFLPGQVVGLTIGADIPPRLYSICSSPDEENLSILFNVKPDGMLSPRLSQINPGDPVRVSAPFGAFLGDHQPAWWIASGTGVAPFRSMARAGLNTGKKLIHGGRFADNFYFQHEFVSLLGDQYIRCCSQEKAPGCYEGRLTQWLRDQSQIPLNQMYYLCGSSEMVVEVRDILISKGVGIEKIMSEIYF